MRKREWTSEEIEWLKENYPVKSDHVCRTHLHISYKRLWLKVEELGLIKAKPTEFEVEKKVQVKCKKRRLFEDDDSPKGYCQDCIRYAAGGRCAKKGKGVGALWQKKCFRGEE